MKVVMKPVLELEIAFTANDDPADRIALCDELTRVAENSLLTMRIVAMNESALKARVTRNTRSYIDALFSLKRIADIDFPAAIAKVRRAARMARDLR
jgi:hypothetical protein